MPRIRCLALIALAALALAFAEAGVAQTVTGADADAELQAAKDYWQDRYRTLLTKRAMLQDVIDREQELYADANRRNYRRGKKRHVHRNAMMEAQDELEGVEASLATIEDEARRAGALPGWLYEVEWELAERGGAGAPPAAADDDEADPLDDTYEASDPVSGDDDASDEDADR